MATENNKLKEKKEKYDFIIKLYKYLFTFKIFKKILHLFLSFYSFFRLIILSKTQKIRLKTFFPNV